MCCSEEPQPDVKRCIPPIPPEAVEYRSPASLLVGNESAGVLRGRPHARPLVRRRSDAAAVSGNVGTSTHESARLDLTGSSTTLTLSAK